MSLLRRRVDMIESALVGAVLGTIAGFLIGERLGRWWK